MPTVGQILLSARDTAVHDRDPNPLCRGAYTLVECHVSNTMLIVFTVMMKTMIITAFMEH